MGHFSVDDLQRNGHHCLVSGDFKGAEACFEAIINSYPNYSPAYIGMLCATLYVKSEADLATYYYPIKSYYYYYMALLHADTEYRRQIEYYSWVIEDRKKLEERLKPRSHNGETKEDALQRLVDGWREAYHLLKSFNSIVQNKTLAFWEQERAAKEKAQRDEAMAAEEAKRRMEQSLRCIAHGLCYCGSKVFFLTGRCRNKDCKATKHQIINFKTTNTPKRGSSRFPGTQGTTDALFKRVSEYGTRVNLADEYLGTNKKRPEKVKQDLTSVEKKLIKAKGSLDIYAPQFQHMLELIVDSTGRSEITDYLVRIEQTLDEVKEQVTLHGYKWH
ncbi:MAG: hypothetical protein FWE11_02620 [Defluviitaleaceae bacterium]|nr:hypothetical protein [Defluviitaleaceae bacterium]